MSNAERSLDLDYLCTFTFVAERGSFSLELGLVLRRDKRLHKGLQVTLAALRRLGSPRDESGHYGP
jgi:hypothetical protein